MSVVVRGQGVEAKNLLQAFLDDCTLAPSRATAHDPSLMVEVAGGQYLSVIAIPNKARDVPQNDEDSSAFRSQRVFNRNLNVLERNVRCASCWGVRRLNRLRLYTLPSLDKNDSEAIVSLAAHGETIGNRKHGRSQTQD